MMIGSIGTMFSHGLARRKRMPERRMASTLRQGIPEKSNAELVGGGLVQPFSAITKAISRCLSK